MGFLTTDQRSNTPHHMNELSSYFNPSFAREPGLELSSYGSHPVSKLQEADVDVLLEPVGDVWVGPTTPILQGLGQVPVVQGDCWLDSVFDKLVDDGIVVVDASLIHFPGPLKNNNLLLNI